MKFKFLFGLLPVGYTLLAIYSFSQIDLNLTLSVHPLYQSFQKQLISLGYFHRPFSMIIYIALIILLVISYLSLVISVKKKLISQRQLWFLVIITVIVLLFSYPAFSHDIFNYIFDARIVTKYGLSPWHYRALDFPSDTWIRFMQWTHRLTPYPPLWIGLSLIPSFLGLGKFTLTLLLFKLMAAGFYLGCCKLIAKLNPQALALFALNPLVVIETLVNGHMEIALIFFALLAIYLNLQHKTTLSWLSFITSVGIKYMTFYLAPVLIKGKHWLRPTIWLGLISTAAFIFWYGFQPWYVLWVLPFALLLPGKSWEIKLLILLSFAALLWNLPAVSSGDFNLPNPTSRLIIYVLLPFAVLTIPFFIKSAHEKIH